MGELFKKPAFIIIFAIALTGSLIWSYVDKRQQAKQEAANQVATTTTQIVNLTNVDATDFDSVVKDELTLANGKAIEINAGEKLAAVEIELPGDLLPSTGSSRYIYTSDSDKSNNWMITIAQASKNYIRALIPKDDYLGDLQALNTNLWKFNYVTALQIAEKNGGLEWRENNQLSSVKLTLRHTPPKNWLVWTVEYSGKDTKFTKVIDANSGQIIDENSSTSSQSTP